MVEMSGCRFEYAGKASYGNQYGYSLMFAHVDTENVRTITGRKDGVFVFNKASKSRYLVGDSYADSFLEFDVEIVTCDGSALSLEAIRYIERWLFVNSKFDKLSIVQYDQGDKYLDNDTWWAYFNCRFLYPEKIESGDGVIGFRCVMQTDGMMMWNDDAVGVDFRSSVITDRNTGEIIIKGDADGDGVITEDDVKICKIVSEYGNVRQYNPTTDEYDTVYSMSNFYNQDGSPKMAYLDILNQIPLPKITDGGVTFISMDTMRKCLVACEPYLTQEQYDLGAGNNIDFSDIKLGYADLIEEKMKVEDIGKYDLHAYITSPADLSNKTVVFSNVNLKLGKTYAILMDSTRTIPTSTYVYVLASDGETIIMARDFGSYAQQGDGTHYKWIITPANNYDDCIIAISSQSRVSADILFGERDINNTVVADKDYIIKGDADGDGEITAADANICLRLYTDGLANYTTGSFFIPIYDEMHEVIGYQIHNEERLNSYGLPAPVTYESFVRSLIACDLSYTQEDYDSFLEGSGRLPDMNNLDPTDTQSILRMYTESVAGIPVDIEKIDVSGGSISSSTKTYAVLVDVNSDIDGYTYPHMTINIGDVGGTIEIENTSDFRENVYSSSDRKTVIINTQPYSSIEINSEISELSGINYNNMTKKYFPRLLTGQNFLKFKGDIASVYITWKSGIFL